MKRCFVLLVLCLLPTLLGSCSHAPRVPTVTTHGSIYWMRWQPVVGEHCPFTQVPAPSRVRFYDPQGQLLAAGTTRSWTPQGPDSCVVVASYSISVPKAARYTMSIGETQGPSSVSFSDLRDGSFQLNALIQQGQVHLSVGKVQTW